MTAGIGGGRSGLIGEVIRLLRRRRAPHILLENVPFMLHLHRGRALEQIVSELEALGYLWAYRVVNTLGFGLPQRRERIFLLASKDIDPSNVLLVDDAGLEREETRIGELAHGFYWTEGIRGLGWAPNAIPTLKNGSTVGIPSPPAILMPNGEVITPDIRDAERLQGFEVDWTKAAEDVRRTSHRWSLIGNAVSVPVAQWLGKRLETPGTYLGDQQSELRPGMPWPRAAHYDGFRRYSVPLSAAPIRCTRANLHEFLAFPGRKLSIKATKGFLARTRRSSLRFTQGFLASVETHLAAMQHSTSTLEDVLEAAE